MNSYNLWISLVTTICRLSSLNLYILHLATTCALLSAFSLKCVHHSSFLWKPLVQRALVEVVKMKQNKQQLEIEPPVQVDLQVAIVFRSDKISQFCLLLFIILVQKTVIACEGPYRNKTLHSGTIYKCIHCFD